jgi:pimeloyl-ACP methyl ester carboxylesterase
MSGGVSAAAVGACPPFTRFNTFCVGLHAGPSRNRTSEPIRSRPNLREYLTLASRDIGRTAEDCKSCLKEAAYMTYAHVTAPTEFAEASGIRFAYRRFGSGHDVPLLFMPHYRAGMDHWDPAVTDGFASSRSVILFDNAGVADSSGETPDTMEAMADHATNFVGALGLSIIDVLGHSIGGYIAQTLALRHPETVRRLILAGTGPRGGEPTRDPKVREWGDSTDPQTGESSLDAFLYLFFRPSPSSQAAGEAFWQRRHLRKDADRPSTLQCRTAQRTAIIAWSKVSGERYAELANIRQPTLVVNGNDDIMIPTINSYNLSQRIPKAQLIIYPDSGHGALFQFPELFVAHGTMFLDAAGTM